MFLQHLQDSACDSNDRHEAVNILHRLDCYTSELRVQLDVVLDRRLVQTFFNLAAIILMFRERRMGLLLSELGSYLCGSGKGPAGTKRLSNLLRSKKWTSKFIDDYFFAQAMQGVTELTQAGKRALLLWDDSRVEKHESWVCEGLCSVWSSKAKRLTRMRPGYYRPPKERICVPGIEWSAVFLSALGQPPRVAQMTWWTSRGKYKEDPDNIIWRLLRKIAQQVSHPVLHVFDRGYASEKMIRYLLHFEQDFLIRWRKNVYLLYEQQRLRIDQISRKTKPRFCRTIYDKERKKTRRISIGWTQLAHPDHIHKTLTLIVVRNIKHAGGPMYLLCSLNIHTAAIAWEMVTTYAHRWEAEQGFRFLKSEMGIESPRLWFWDNRLKLMAIVTLVYDFLLQTLRQHREWVMALFRRWCHRTGERYRLASVPLYRLRLAISACLFSLWAQSSG
ncbi:MAG: transposase [Lewinella sp.]|nr:transposase [Lewinella sp.]